MKLASIQRISNITPIEGADLIETATVLGWEVVIKKGEYKVGDLCTYIQIDTDTVVPDLPEYEFLRERKFRVRTIKIRKQISQGLIVPLPTIGTAANYKEGDDVTLLLGVTKYEKADNNPKKVRPKVPKKWYKKWLYYFLYSFLYRFFPQLEKKDSSPFPTNLVSITDEERIQNIPKVLSTHKGKEFVVSYKFDGSSITIIHEKRLKLFHKFRICSRRFELHDTNNDWYKVFKLTNFQSKIMMLVEYFDTDNIIVQGEAIGKFNGNHHNLQQDEIRLFNIFVDGVKLNQNDFIYVCLLYNIPHCEMYKKVFLDHTMPEILKMSEIKDVLNPNVEAEGLVWRCVEDNLSFKVINNKYLLSKNE